MLLKRLFHALIYQILLVFTIRVSTVSSIEKGCAFTISENTPKTPFILKNQNNPEFLYPLEEKNVIRIAKGEKIRLSCAGEYFHKTFHVKELTARCVKNDIVQLKYHILWKQEIKLQNLECKVKPDPAVRFTDKRCYSNNIVIDIGYVINKNFLTVYSVCFDNFEEKTLYSWYKNSHVFLGHEEKVKNSAYAGQNSFSYNITRVYEYDYQKEVFAKILKSEDLADRYIRNNYLFTIVSSPLLTKDEFVYGPEQSATFHYLNTAPQWKIFSQGNWKVLETSFKQMLANRGFQYGVASGVYDVMTLPDLFKEEKKIYLAVDEFENDYLAVPKYYWRVMYDYRLKIGYAFVGIHNPFMDSEKYKDLVFCKDICDQIDWLSIDNSRRDQGYVFCCDLKEFLAVTGYENMFE